MPMRSNVGWKANRHVAISLATCVGLGACTALTEPSASNTNTTVTQVGAPGMASVPQFRASGKGKNYEWGKDHIFIKLSSAESGGVLTLIQDNLKPGFNLGLHLHRTHSEIFYILDGEVEFTVGEKPVTATAGSVVYLPAGTPHAAKSSKGGKMLMFYTPGGFDEMLAEIDSASWFQRINPFASARRNQKYDLHKVSDGALTATDGPKPRFLTSGEGKAGEAGGIVKLSSAETKGLGVVIEQRLAPGIEREPQLLSNQAEIVYVLDGELEFRSGDNMRTATKGATIYFAPGMPSKVKSSTGAKILVFRTPGA